MRSDVTGWKAIGRASALDQVVVATLVAAVLLVAGPHREVAVPARSGVTSVLWPLAPLLPAVVLPIVVGRVRGVPWRLSVRPPRAVGFPVVLAYLGPVLALPAVAITATSLDPWILARNAALLGGLSLLGAVVLTPALAWSPAVLAAAATWLFGTRFGGGVEGWAVLLQPREHAVGGWLALITVTGAIVVCLTAAWRRASVATLRVGAPRRTRWRAVCSARRHHRPLNQ